MNNQQSPDIYWPTGNDFDSQAVNGDPIEEATHDQVDIATHPDNNLAIAKILSTLNKET